MRIHTAQTSSARGFDSDEGDVYHELCSGKPHSRKNCSRWRMVYAFEISVRLELMPWRPCGLRRKTVDDGFMKSATRISFGE